MPAPPSPAGRAAASASKDQSLSPGALGGVRPGPQPHPGALHRLRSARNDIPGSPAFVAAAGITLGDETGWFGGLRWRYFGPRPLIEDGSIWSGATSLFNVRAGYVFENGLKLQLDGFNIFNSQASQIDYYYQSQLRTVAGPVNDIHFHPVEPMAFRFTLAKAF